MADIDYDTIHANRKYHEERIALTKERNAIILSTLISTAKKICAQVCLDDIDEIYDKAFKTDCMHTCSLNTFLHLGHLRLMEGAPMAKDAFAPKFVPSWPTLITQKSWTWMVTSWAFVVNRITNGMGWDKEESKREVLLDRLPYGAHWWESDTSDSLTDTDLQDVSSDWDPERDVYTPPPVPLYSPPLLQHIPYLNSPTDRHKTRPPAQPLRTPSPYASAEEDNNSTTVDDYEDDEIDEEEELVEEEDDQGSENDSQYHENEEDEGYQHSDD